MRVFGGPKCAVISSRTHTAIPKLLMDCYRCICLLSERRPALAGGLLKGRLPYRMSNTDEESTIGCGRSKSCKLLSVSHHPPIAAAVECCVRVLPEGAA